MKITCYSIKFGPQVGRPSGGGLQVGGGLVMVGVTNVGGTLLTNGGEKSIKRVAILSDQIELLTPVFRIGKKSVILDIKIYTLRTAIHTPYSIIKTFYNEI